MTEQINGEIVDSLTLRFTGEDEDGVPLHELRAEHVAEVLQGLVGLTSDFDKAGAFGAAGPVGSEILVRPAKEGSFLIEVIRVAAENWEGIAAVAGVPTLSNVIWWSTKSARAEVQSFVYLDNGNVKIDWQDNTSQEVPAPVWEELNKRKRRRKKQLQQIMTPLTDERVQLLDVAGPSSSIDDDDETPDEFALSRVDYYTVTPTDEIEEESEFLELEAQMSAIDFEDSTKWKVKAAGKTRSATVEDQVFLQKVEAGLAIRKDDIFWVRMREDKTTKNGRTATKWTVLLVDEHRRASGVKKE